MKASDLFVRCLEKEGFEYVFGVPGEENADFMISLEQSASVRFILTRHEQGAAFMAEICQPASTTAPAANSAAWPQANRTATPKARPRTGFVPPPTDSAATAMR